MLPCNISTDDAGMSYAAAGRGTEPAKVYPASDRRDCWVVEAPRDSPASEHVRLFSGVEAQRQAVQFAYEAFGGARLFVR